MLVRTRPYRPVAAFDRSFDRAFDQLTRSFSSTPRTPVVDASWQDGSLVLSVDLPGTPAEHIAVGVAARTLTIAVSGEHGSWERSLRLGATLDADAVSASYLNGRLTVTVAPAAQPEPRSIAISTEAPAPIEVAAPDADATPAEDAQPEAGTSENA